MNKNAKTNSFIEIINETKSGRQHIKAEGIIPSIIVALYLVVLVLGAFENMAHGFFSGIFDIIRKLRKHNYYFYGFQKKSLVWFKCSL